MLTPSRRTSPEVMGKSPVTQLKAVVLPAPLGPIIERISRSATAKLRSETASSPPKRLLRLATSSSATSGDSLDGGQRLRLACGFELNLPGAARQEAARSEQHHQDQSGPIQDIRVRRELDAGQRRDVERLAHRRRLLVHVRTCPEDHEGE